MMSAKIPTWGEWRALHPGASKLRYDAMVRREKKAGAAIEREGEPAKPKRPKFKLPAGPVNKGRR